MVSKCGSRLSATRIRIKLQEFHGFPSSTCQKWRFGRTGDCEGAPVPKTVSKSQELRIGTIQDRQDATVMLIRSVGVSRLCFGTIQGLQTIEA
eukprot:9483869-Pyramimonas_sp.AAC.1